MCGSAHCHCLPVVVKSVMLTGLVKTMAVDYQSVANSVRPTVESLAGRAFSQFSVLHGGCKVAVGAHINLQVRITKAPSALARLRPEYEIRRSF